MKIVNINTKSMIKDFDIYVCVCVYVDTCKH